MFALWLLLCCGFGLGLFLIVTGHGGNAPAAAVGPDFMRERPGAQVLFHSWWNGPMVWPVVQAIDPDASHASWLESFPWTRVAGVEPPEGHKQPVDAVALRVSDPAALPAFGAPSLTRGRHQVVLSNPRRMLVNGLDVATDYFRAACITPTDLAVSSDHRIYVGLHGGGVLVGRPA